MKHFVLVSGLLLLAACSKKDPAPPVFEGYTGRDAHGELFGPTDPTDWTLDATWDSRATALFEKAYGVSFAKPLLAASTWQPVLYPNPASPNSQATFSLTVDKTNTAVPANVRMAYAIVDANYAPLSSGSAYSATKSFGFVTGYGGDKFKINTLYRFYYIVYDDATLQVCYKGHGDIQF